MKYNKPDFTAWTVHFREWEGRQLPLPWESGAALTPEERRKIARSIQVFQLGESSDGRRFKDLAVRHALRGGPAAYPAAVQHFIAEENRHSDLLSRFMSLAGIPPTSSHWMDGLFRGLRHAQGIRGQVRTLLTAELIATAYYDALRQATQSPLLRGICRQILTDEAAHIAFQSEALHALIAPRGRVALALHRLKARVLLEAALAVVWRGHARVFRAAGYNYRWMRRISLQALERSLKIVENGPQEQFKLPWTLGPHDEEIGFLSGKRMRRAAP